MKNLVFRPEGHRLRSSPASALIEMSAAADALDFNRFDDDLCLVEKAEPRAMRRLERRLFISVSAARMDDKRGIGAS